MSMRGMQLEGGLLDLLRISLVNGSRIPTLSPQPNSNILQGRTSKKSVDEHIVDLDLVATSWHTKHWIMKATDISSNDNARSAFLTSHSVPSLWACAPFDNRSKFALASAAPLAEALQWCFS